ncbi:hypothetical protein KFE94_08830 [bacterium SCSIO 12643]|nr:hypothetical protein KFE94_08830 [bacterium SCSIO 12643]
MEDKSNLIDEIFEKVVRWHLNPENKDYGLLTGKTGECVFFYNLYTKTGEARFMGYIGDFISDVVSNPEKIFNKVTLCDGAAGFVWFLKFLQRNKEIESIYDVIDKDLTNFLFESAEKQFDRGNWDYMHGALGIILALADDEPRFIHLMEEKLLSLKKEDGGGFIWESEMYGDKINLGIAHGLPSIVYFLGKYREHLTSIDSMFIDTILTSVTNSKLGHGHTSLYPSFMGDDSVSRLGWCYGDISIGSSLLDVSKLNKKAENILLETARHSMSRKDKSDTLIADSCICHGTAGVELIYNKFYKNYTDQGFKDFAQYMNAETGNLLRKNNFKFFDRYSSEWMENYSLLEGLSGVGLVLLGVDNGWDECIMLS